MFSMNHFPSYLFAFVSCKSYIHYLICSVDLCLLHVTNLKPLERQDILIRINSKSNYVIKSNYNTSYNQSGLQKFLWKKSSGMQSRAKVEVKCKTEEKYSWCPFILMDFI